MIVCRFWKRKYPCCSSGCRHEHRTEHFRISYWCSDKYSFVVTIKLLKHNYWGFSFCTVFLYHIFFIQFFGSNTIWDTRHLWIVALLWNASYPWYLTNRYTICVVYRQAHLSNKVILTKYTVLPYAKTTVGHLSVTLQKVDWTVAQPITTLVPEEAFTHYLVTKIFTNPEDILDAQMNFVT